jgi:hypothetical protein
MPQFTQWNVPSPFPNVLYNPVAVDAAIAKTQSELGNLDINQQELQLKKDEFARGQSFADTWNKSIDGTTGTTGAAAGGGGGSFLSALAQIESGDKNIVSGTDKDNQGLTLAQGGNPTEISQGHFQIHTGTWKDFAPQAGVDINKYPNAMSAPREVQAQVASVIPFKRFGPRTQTMMRQQFGDIDSNRTVGELAGLGPRAGSAAVAGPVAVTPPPATQQAGPLPVPPIPPGNPNAGPRIGLVPPSAVATTPPPAQTGQADDPNMAAVKQASTALLAMPEPDAAAAYPAVVRELQARGFALNAPPEYPGHAALRALVGGGQADEAVPVAPSPIALRTGGTDTAGPAAGQTTLPPVEQPNRMYQTGLAGVTINAPGNPLAPPPVVTAAAPAAPAAPATAPPGATRPPLEAPPAAPTRVIPREPLIQSGPAAGLTRTQAVTIGQMLSSGAKPAVVMQHADEMRHQNDVIRQGDATQAAIEQQQNYERRLKSDETQYTRGRQAEIDKRSAEELAIKQAAEKRAADKEAADQKARIKGDAIAAQHENTLLEGTESGETNTAKYASAYSKFAEGRYNADGSFVKPTMSAYAKPTFIPPGAAEVPDYGKQETPGPLPPPAVMTGMQGNVSGIKNINQVLRELDAHPNSVGMKALQGEWALQYTDPEGIALRAGIADILSQTFHDRSGASVTISESPRLKPFVPAPTDTVAALRTKLERLRAIYRDVLEDNYSVYGPEGTGRSLPVIERTLKQTPKASDKTDAATAKPPPPGSKVIIP